MTPAVDQLVRSGVTHRVVSYNHDPNAESFGREAVVALGLNAAEVFKTLVVDLGSGGLAVAVVPVDSQLNLKAVAKAAGAKKAKMADPAAVERSSGYVLGGVSPLGQKRTLPTFVDRSALDLEEMHVSAGRRGLEVALSPNDLVDLLDATPALIAAN